MAEEQQELRRVNWNEIFSFTHIFKSFRMAIHPTKLMLALGAIVLIYVCGNVMDGFWGLGNEYVKKDEIYSHFEKSSDQFHKYKQQWQAGRSKDAANCLADALRERHYLTSYTGILSNKAPGSYLVSDLGDCLADHNRNKEANYRERTADEILTDTSRNGASWTDLLDEAQEEFGKEVDKIRSLLEASGEMAREHIKKDLAEKQKQKQQELDNLDEHLDLACQALTERKVEFRRKFLEVRGRRIFASLLDYESHCIREAVRAVAHGKIFGGLAEYRQKRTGAAIPALEAGAVDVPSGPGPASAQAGFVYWGLLAFHAILWLICEHWAYAIIFLLFSLAVCALAGGAVHRIAAVHFAREEKISWRQALKFSVSKFLSFFTAPLLPLAFVFGIGVVLMVGGLIGAIPYVGEILMSLLFFVAILFGLGAAFLLVGLVGGGAMMYPTIAVEGSDCFDAISRSFSYVFNRPWRAALYGLVALVYGVITYLFVRLFVYLALAAVHFFVKWGVIGQGASLHPDADKLDVMWTAPTFDSLFGPFSWEAMNGTQTIGAFIIGIWVFLAAGVVMAYLLSYAASSTTVIYYLLRRKVDATDLDDVYIEEAEEELAPAAEPEAPAEAPSAPQAGPTGEAEKPADEGEQEKT